MTLKEHIESIADSIVFVAEKFMEHPDDIAKIHSISMLVDREIIERMKKKGGIE